MTDLTDYPLAHRILALTLTKDQPMESGAQVTAAAVSWVLSAVFGVLIVVIAIIEGT